MFDVLDIQLPRFVPSSEREVRRHESAFGQSDEAFLFVDGVKLGRVRLASEAYSTVAAWTGSPERSVWTVLLTAATANDALATDETWAAFLSSLKSLLDAHSFWRVICESHCEQHSLETVILSAAALVNRLDYIRRNRSLPIAFEASPPP